MTSLLKLVCLLWVFVAGVFTFPVPCGTSHGSMAYDAPSEAISGYDGTSLLVFDYDSASKLSVSESVNRIRGEGGVFAQFTKSLAAERVAIGSGPASGYLQVSDGYASSKAVQNFASPNTTDFIFDPQSGRFVMGNGPWGHDSILQAAAITPSETTVGGTIWRENGSLMTDEWSGHYGQNWTPEIR